MLSEQQQNLIKELEYYVTSEETFDIRTLIASLITEFPDFYYQGLGFRAIRGQWNEEKSFNFSWSLDFESAVEACESFTSLSGDIYVYESIIKGFDLDLFVRNQLKNQVKFSPNFLSFALKEKEILVISHSSVTCIEVIKKIF